MKTYLGLDTSNYTTSAAYYCPESNTLCQNKKLLPVKEGELGLRQSDALFHHVRQLSPIIQDLWNNNQGEIAAVCVSDKPRNVEGSYMPCFLAGKLVAEAAGKPTSTILPNVCTDILPSATSKKAKHTYMDLRWL